MPYYLQDGQKTLGPFSVADLIARPEFSIDSLIFPVGAGDEDAWKPAHEYPEVAAAASAAPAPSAINLVLPPPKPRPAPPPPPAAAPQSCERAPDVSDAPKAIPPPGDFLILIVDDDETVRSLFEFIVGSAGYRVATAADGIAAGRALSTLKPNLIITDLMMPGVGGYEFLRSLQTSESKRIPIIVVTASDRDKSTIAMIRQEANVVEFISKPINSKNLLLVLEKTLRPAF